LRARKLLIEVVENKKKRNTRDVEMPKGPRQGTWLLWDSVETSPGGKITPTKKIFRREILSGA